MDEQAWREKSGAILTDVKEWRGAHPKATYVEIEKEVHRRLMELEAQMLQDLAQASPSRAWGKQSGQPAVLCPSCLVPLQARGQQKRTLQGNGGQQVTLKRTYGICLRCGEGFFPLDEELALLPGNLAPRQQEHLVHLAGWMPFDKAAQMIEEILSVQTSQETVRHITERTGACMEAAQAAEAPCPLKANDQPPKLRCVFSADGAMVSLVNKQWVEARTVVIGEPKERINADGQQEMHVGSLSYFSRLADASTFIALATVEMERRKVKETQEVCAVMDGADWLQSFTERHRSDAVRVLDFAHAAQHLAQLFEALESAGVRFPPRMLDRCLHILHYRGPGCLLRLADRHFGNGQQTGENTHLSYLRSREALMHYPQFRRQGWPIGSGMVESANKNVVEARLKGTGMHWQRQQVNPMLALRNAICNDRWQEMWQKALKELRRQRALQRSARRQTKKAPSEHSFSLPIQETTPMAILPASSCSPSSQPTFQAQKRQTRPYHRRLSPQTASEANGDRCICGTPLRPSPGSNRVKRYCSPTCGTRARMRAKREREKQGISFLNPPSPQSAEGNEFLCMCGTRFTQPGKPGVNKRYCSPRCAGRARMQAKRERDKQWLSASLQPDRSSEP